MQTIEYCVEFFDCHQEQSRNEAIFSRNLVTSDKARLVLDKLFNLMQLTGTWLDPDDSFQRVTQHLGFKFDCKPTDHTTCFELADTLRDAGSRHSGRPRKVTHRDARIDRQSFDDLRIKHI